MRNYAVDRHDSESRKSILWLAFCALAIFAALALIPQRSMAQTSAGFNASTDAMNNYPDLVRSLKYVDAIGNYPQYMGMSPTDLDRKIGAFNKYQKQLSTTTLSGDLFEVLVGFFSHGDPNLARQLRNSTVFKQAVAVLMDPSARPESVNVALGQLSEVSGMNRSQIMGGLSTMAMGGSGGGELSAANQMALGGNLAAGKIYAAQNAEASGLNMGGFDSPEVTAANEGQIFSPGPAQFAYQQNTPPGQQAMAFGAGGGFLPEAPSAPPASNFNNTTPSISAPSLNLRGQSAHTDFSHGSPDVHATSAGSGLYAGVGAGVAPASVKAAAVPAASSAADPMLSMLGGDYAKVSRYKGAPNIGTGYGHIGTGLPSEGYGIEFTSDGHSRIASDYISCFGNPEKKADDPNKTLAQLCYANPNPDDACKTVVQCQCYRDFQKVFPENFIYCTAGDKCTKKLQEIPPTTPIVSLQQATTTNDGSINTMDDILGQATPQTSKQTAITDNVKATALIQASQNFVDSQKTINGITYGPAQHLSLLMNTLVGTNRGLCMLGNGVNELPWGENAYKRAQFQFYENQSGEIDDGLKGKQHPKACSRVDSADLSGGWTSQADRIQVVALFRLIDKMRTIQEKQKAALINKGTVPAPASASKTPPPPPDSFEKDLLNPAAFKPTELQGVNQPHASNALASALDPACGDRGWFYVLEGAELALRPAALACDNPSKPDETLEHQLIGAVVKVKPTNLTEPLSLIACAKPVVPAQSPAQVTSFKSNSDQGHTNDLQKTFLARNTASITNSQTTIIKPGVDITSQFLLDYLNPPGVAPQNRIKKYPSALDQPSQCTDIRDKYININKILTQIYRGELKSGLPNPNYATNDSAYCNNFLHNNAASHK